MSHREPSTSQQARIRAAREAQGTKKLDRSRRAKELA